MSIATFTHEALADIEAGFHAILHKLHLDHGIPAEDIEKAKVAASALLPVIEKTAEPLVEKVIATEVPTDLQPVAEALVPVVESAASEAVAPVTE
jgi:hypothetical protein